MLSEFLIAIVIVLICLLLHVGGIVLTAQWVLRQRDQIERTGAKVPFSFFMIVSFSIIILLHLLEATIWGGFYYARSMFKDFETSLYFSLISYTTIGYGDVLLPDRWRLLGAIEGISGVLLCGTSTAFIFAVINGMFQLRLQQRQSQNASEQTSAGSVFTPVRSDS